MTPVAGHPHAMIPGGATFTLDANGNFTQLGSQTLTWNEENQLASVVSSTVNESYLLCNPPPLPSSLG